MSKDTRNVPALRFKGFSDAWEKRKLIYFLNVSDQKNSKGTFSKKDVLSVSGEFGIVNQIQFQGRSFAGVSVKKYGIVEKGDIVYTKSPLKRNPFGIIKVNRGQAGIVSTLYAIYKPRKTVCPSIIDYYFQSDTKLNNYLRPLVNKGAKNDMKVKNIDVLKGLVILPLNLDEQKKDIFFLDNITNLIAATQDKLDHFEEIKKALLKHLFDQSMRFKGYSDPWEKRKLGEIADIRGGGTPSTSKPEYWDGEIDWYAPAEIGTQRYVSGSRRQITNLGLNKSSATMLPANKTILFTSRAGIGNAAILTKSGATNQGFQSIVVKPATDIYFLYSEVPEIKRKAIRLAAGSTFLEISGKSLSKIQIWLPSFKEQSRIGHLFLQIDNLIAATQSKLSSLESLKKALLQGLFI
ncbi:restriction endonuclease subunit S [Lacticaseibacillus rhamnosus]|uniref:restriction endonuclease subunit S n=1 Tax=Lacticaseibacillus rhamnosus TaxID=47715 RepID=UPI0006676E91|nr:restriction endonuclease subunit S [Lacticaseibacillus rhamnosus]